MHYTDAFEAARDKRFRIEEDRNVMEARVGKLLNHRIDVLLETHFTDDPARMLDKLGRNNPKFDPDALALQRLPDLGHSVHFAIARSHPDQKLLAQVNKGLQQLRRTGELDRILATR